MPFKINPAYPVRQLFGYQPGYYLKDSQESLGPPLLMRGDWIERCFYVGREDSNGICFKDQATGWCFVQPRSQVILKIS